MPHRIFALLAALSVGACGDSIAPGSIVAAVPPDGRADAAADTDATVDAEPTPTCTPNTIICADDTLTECSADGWPNRSPCPLGCFGDGTRCWDVEPSAYLAGMLELARTSPALQLGGATIDTTSGRVVIAGNEVNIPSVLLPGPPAIRVFAGSGISLGNVTILGQHAAAFVSHGPLFLAFYVSLGDGHGPQPGSRTEGCITGYRDDGLPLEVGSAVDGRFAGGGGGAHVTAGGRGGDNPPGLAGGGGRGFDDDDLNGGCSGSGVGERLEDGSLVVHAAGGGGGGAVHFLSDTYIRLQLSGAPGVRLYATGNHGEAAGTGGGAGGRIVFEAPEVTIDPKGGRGGHIIDARGGEGLGSCDTGGGPCSGPGASRGGAGGNGSSLPGNGGSLTGTVADSHAGGGGGAVGRIIVVARDGGFVPSGSALFSPLPEVRLIGRR